MHNFMKMLGSVTRVVLLLLIVTLCYLSIRQLPIPQELNNIITTVVAFFFGTKASDIIGGNVNRQPPVLG